MFKRSLSAVVLVALLTVMLSFPAWAVPGLINYQGKLTDSGGNALNGTFSMTFLIYSANIGGTALWNETQSVQVIDGIYSIELGSVSSFPADLFDSDALYLEVVIGSETLTPRQRLTSTAFSMKAGDADTVAGLTPSEIAASSHSHDGSDITTGTVEDSRIANSIARDSEITWANLANIPADLADGDDVGITSESDPTVAASVKDGVSWEEVSGIPSGFADGVDNVGGGITGVNAGGGLTGGGSSGDVTVNVGAGTGIDVSSNAVSVEVPLSLSGSASYGDAIISATSTGIEGYGVYGFCNKGLGVYGEHGNGNYGYLGSSGHGVYGNNLNGNYGYLGSSGYGVHGLATNGYGVHGKHDSSGNYGYLGSSSYGVYGKNANGTYGYLGSSAYGVVGYYNGSSIGAGVYGGSSSSWAGYFNGPVQVTGTLSKLGGGFQIDHPLDPENKYLNHSFVESPEMKNIYDGVVVLDASGERWVELPEWFEALNKNYRYQLTCIGGFAQDTKVWIKVCNAHSPK